jgi:DNA-binding transcriptional LysR family regulator
MQLRQLEYVAAIVRYKTMGKAAHNLYVSEATMSQQLRTLEEELGFPLFERHGGLLRLSIGGEKVLPDLHTLLHAKQKLEQSVMTIKNPASGSFQLGVTEAWARISWNQSMEKKGIFLSFHFYIKISEARWKADSLAVGQIQRA